jgi:hypothetical protein
MKSKIFIASSSESLPLAEAFHTLVENFAEPHIWHLTTYGPSSYSIPSLVKKSKECDFGAFFLTPDDVAVLRGQTVPVTRDNVLFELGLFIGELGLERIQVIRPSEETAHLASDLVGLNTSLYGVRSDGNYKARLLTAATDLSNMVTRLGHKGGSSAPKTISPAPSYSEYSDIDVVALLSDYLLRGREYTYTLQYDKIDKELHFKPGMSERNMEAGAEAAGYNVIIKGPAVVNLKRKPSMPQNFFIS